MLGKKGRQIVGWFSNFYVLTTLFFLIWGYFFDQQNMPKIRQLEKKVHSLQQLKDYYEKKINQFHQEISTLEKNPDYMEKYARMHYFMKKEGEDIYVIREDDR